MARYEMSASHKGGFAVIDTWQSQTIATFVYEDDADSFCFVKNENNEVEAMCKCGWAGGESELVIVGKEETEIQACPKCGSTKDWIDIEV